MDDGAKRKREQSWDRFVWKAGDIQFTKLPKEVTIPPGHDESEVERFPRRGEKDRAAGLRERLTDSPEPPSDEDLKEDLSSRQSQDDPEGEIHDES